MRNLFYLILLITVTSTYLYSQCGCVGGAAVGGLTPIGGTANVGLLREDYFRASLFYSYSYGDKFFRGDARAEKDIVEHYETQFSSLMLGYGFTEDITLETEIGYFPRKLQDFGSNNAEGSGLSHLSVIGKYNLFSSIVKEIEFTMGLGARLPLELKQENLPQHVRPSTGAYGIIFQAFFHLGNKKADMHFFVINRSEYNFENKSEYQYGPTVNTSLYYTKGILKNLTGIIELRNEYRLKDKINGEEHKDSGGLFFHVAPQINYTLGQFNVSALFDYPIYQYYNGYQLGNNYTIGLNFTWMTRL
ncbi:hypothetical protein D9V86_01705 [Bacteroidetes/Chlorobi group bacterium ChocPot_Mid]|nr:MAG: hypothetical protein D9V86_01705 [Bacteroidetes/Chlorobi group bacterium ChocPot_Mid]